MRVFNTSGKEFLVRTTAGHVTAVIFAEKSFFRQRYPCVFSTPRPHANALIVSGLSGCESIRGQEVEFLVRTTAGQKETDTARIFQDHGTDLEQL